MPFQLTESIRLDLLEQDTTDKVMDACEPSGIWRVRRPVRQFTQLYTFIRQPVPAGGRYNWDEDDQLQSCIALSRLVHPTSISLEYSARVFHDWEGKIVEVCPGPVTGPASYAYTLPDCRDWLVDDDLGHLKRLMNGTPWTKLPARLQRALWYHEMAAASWRVDIWWTLTCTALEALIHTDRLRTTKQFTSRIPLLAGEVGIMNFSEKDAEDAYEYRSRMAHGGTLADLRNMTPTHYDSIELPLYRKTQDILREAIRKSILTPAFASIFLTDDSVRSHWPLPGS